MSHKAIDILRTLTESELKRFTKLVNSPFFNESKKLIQFYEELVNYYPKFNSGNLNDEYLSKKINPHLKFNKSTITNLFCDLAIMLEKYLLLINLENKEVESYDFIREEFFKRKLNKYFEQNAQKADKMLEQTGEVNADYYYNKFRLSTDMLNSLVVNKPKSNSTKIGISIDLFTKRGKYLTYLFVKEMMRVSENLLTLSKTFQIDKDNFVFRLFETIDFTRLLKLITSSAGHKPVSKLFRAYFAMFHAFSMLDDEKCYWGFKRFVLANVDALAPNEVRFLTGRLIRYCLIKIEINPGGKFAKELFNVHSLILERGYYKSSLTQYLPVELFRTTLLESLKLKKYKWALNFIKKYYPKLHPDRRRNMYHYSMAELYFHKRKFEDAMSNFHKVKLNHFMLKIDLKNLMLMTYYELSLFESALSLIDSYRHFLIKDNTLTLAEKKKYRNFINTVDKMIRLKTSVKPAARYYIERHLNSDLPFRDWINEKIFELENKYSKSA